MEALRLLLAASFCRALAYAAWLSSRDPFASGACLFAVGFFASLHYPIAKAQAYRAFPGNSGAVNAVLTLVGIAEIPLPLLLGWIVDHAGLAAALALLGAQPLGLAALAVARPGREGTPRF